MWVSLISLKTAQIQLINPKPKLKTTSLILILQNNIQIKLEIIELENWNPKYIFVSLWVSPARNLNPN